MLANKLDVYARACYRIMLGINQKQDHVSNEDLYKRVRQEPISDTIDLRQIQFTGHCLRMATDEPVHRFLFYESNIKDRLRQGKPRKTYRQQISALIAPGVPTLSSEEIQAYAKDRNVWKLHFVVPRQKKPPDIF